jgi:actin-related protein
MGDDMPLGKPWLVMDYGSYSMNAGLVYSGNDIGDHTGLQNCIGEPIYDLLKTNQCMTMGGDAQLLFGEDLTPNRGICKLKWPMERGVIKDWETMEKIWHQITEGATGKSTMRSMINHRENGDDTDAAGVFLMEPCLNCTKNRDKVAKYWFEERGVERLFIGLTSVISFLGTGKGTGVAVTSGHGVTECIPMFDYYGMRHAFQRINWAGQDMTDWLKRELHKADVALESSADELIINDIKEKACYVAPFGQYDAEVTKLKDTPVMFALPDGSSVSINEELIAVPEIMFNPLLAGKDVPGIHKMIIQCVERCPMDTRAGIYERIQLFGGTMEMKGYRDRLNDELGALAQKRDIQAAPRTVLLSDQRQHPFMGAGILCSQSQFDNNMWVTRAQYEEEGGTRCVDRFAKC